MESIAGNILVVTSILKNQHWPQHNSIVESNAAWKNRDGKRNGSFDNVSVLAVFSIAIWTKMYEYHQLLIVIVYAHLLPPNKGLGLYLAKNVH